MTDAEMAAGQREFVSHFDALEREAILIASAKCPDERTRADWAVLGWPFGPPVYARPEMEACDR
jgi:hypothetical protein